MSKNKEQKRLKELLKTSQCNNKYDSYRLKSMLDEYLMLYLEEEYEAKVDERFSNTRLLLGTVALVALLTSHFHGVEWPQAYPLVAAGVIIYVLATTLLTYYEANYTKDSIMLFIVSIYIVIKG